MIHLTKQLINAGKLGDVYHGKTQMLRQSGIPRIGSWFTQTKFAGGGSVYDIGVHALDRCLYLMGEFEAAAVSGKTYAEFGPRGLGDGSWGKGEIDPSKPFDAGRVRASRQRQEWNRQVVFGEKRAGSCGHSMSGVRYRTPLAGEDRQ